MHKLIADTSIDGYINDLELLPNHHICKIKNQTGDIFTIAYRDSRDNKDILLFDNIVGNSDSSVFINRYDDLDCIRYDDGTIIRF